MFKFFLTGWHPGLLRMKCPMSNDTRVAIFVDAENLTLWLKQNGVEGLLEELSSLGTVVVRKAYARWTSAGVMPYQATLNRLGFELVHSFHPVSGKNSADIQIVVDVMEYAMREDLQCIVLATGDSDFSPLFRRLREMGKQVVGAGPRSALSESVKSSCSRFFYTQTEEVPPQDEPAARASAFDDAADLLDKALKTFDGPANCCALKPRMLNIDSAFDEKKLGFKSFTDFVKAAGVEVTQHGQVLFASSGDGNHVSPPDTGAAVATNDKSPAPDVSEKYRGALRKKGWRALPVALFVECVDLLRSVEASPRTELSEKAVARSNGKMTTTDLRKALDLLAKSGLMEQKGTNGEGDKLWHAKRIAERDMFRAVDVAMLARLMGGLGETSPAPKKKYLKPLFIGQYSDDDIEHMLTEAKQIRPPAKMQEV